MRIVGIPRAAIDLDSKMRTTGKEKKEQKMLIKMYSIIYRILH